MRQIAVIGLGRFGSTVALELQRLDHYVIAIDSDDKIVRGIADQVSHALVLDATNREALLDAGLQKLDVAVVSIGANTHASILATLLLKEIGIRKVFAKAANKHHATILQRVGADRVFRPEEEMGLRCARSISAPNLLDYIELGPGYSIAEVLASDRMVGKTLLELNLREIAGVNILIIKRRDKVNAVPKGNDVIEKDDVLIVAGPDEHISRIKET